MDAKESVIAEKEETTILNVIQRIKDRTIEPKTLDKETRHGCIEVLIGEGYTQAQIAQILKCSDKTIHRDCKEIRKKNSFAPNVEQAKELVGEVVFMAMQHHSRLVQMAKGPSSLAEKSQAEYLAWKVLDGLIARLQTLGYMPLKPQTIVGDIFHHSDSEAPSPEEEIEKLEGKIREIAQTLGNDSESRRVREALKQYRVQINMAKTELKVNQLWEKRTQKLSGIPADGNEAEP